LTPVADGGIVRATTLSTTTPNNRFAERIRDRLIDNKLAGRKPDSIRSLAKTMANGDPAKAETFKRSLFKWMANGGAKKPSPASRALVAEALGLDRSELSDDDDEEADSLSLDEFLRRRIREFIREETRA
jgi:hypothetical protein